MTAAGGNPVQRLKAGEDPDILARELKERLRDGRTTVTQASVMARDRDPEVAALGARALAGSGQPDALHALTQAIAETADPEQRQLLAAESALEFDVAMAEPLVGIALHADDEAVLAMAQQALAHIADRTVLAALRDRVVAAADARQAARLGDAIRLIENEALASDLIALSGAAPGKHGPALSHAAIEALGGIGTEAAARHLLGALGTAADDDRETYARSIARIRNEEGLATLIRAAAPAAAGAPGPAIVQAAAIGALGNYDHPDLRGLLRSAFLNAGDATVRAAAAASLKRVEENIAAVSHASEDAP